MLTLTFTLAHAFLEKRIEDDGEKVMFCDQHLSLKQKPGYTTGTIQQVSSNNLPGTQLTLHVDNISTSGWVGVTRVLLASARFKTNKMSPKK